ncbi:MAG: hypothetical protein V4713_01050 [Pseudomonadota bacterium]
MANNVEISTVWFMMNPFKLKKSWRNSFEPSVGRPAQAGKQSPVFFSLWPYKSQLRAMSNIAMNFLAALFAIAH